MKNAIMDQDFDFTYKGLTFTLTKEFDSHDGHWTDWELGDDVFVEGQSKPTIDISYFHESFLEEVRKSAFEFRTNQAYDDSQEKADFEYHAKKEQF